MKKKMIWLVVVLVVVFANSSVYARRGSITPNLVNPTTVVDPLQGYVEQTI